MRILIDTSVIVEWERGNKEAAEALKIATEKHDAAISIVTATEYLVGAHHKEKLVEAHDIIGQFKIEEYDLTIANETAKNINERLKEGKPIVFQDSIIEATARKTNRMLVTDDKKHFKEGITIKELLTKINQEQIH